MSEGDKKKRAPRRSARDTKPKEVRNDLTSMFQFMQQNPFGFGGIPGSAQVSQTDTMFQELRWYLISNMRQLLSEAYAEIGLVQVIVDTPVNDAFRGGIEIHSKQIDEEELQYLMAYMDRERDIHALAQAFKWNRLYGGAGLIIMTGNDDRTQPLSIDQVVKGQKLGFRAADLWELFYSKQNIQDMASVMDGDGKGDGAPEFYDYYGNQLHQSRVMKLTGLEAPSFIRPRLRGWGLSVIETLIRSFNQYMKSIDLAFEVLDEFKVDVYKIKNFASALMTANGEAALTNRLTIANQQKNYQNAITMDAEDDYVQKQLTFSGLADIMREIRIQIASEMRMPLAKIFGFGSTGFSSGEDDIENYNAMVESEIRQKAKYDLTNMIEFRCAQLFGVVPTDLKIHFKPLRVLSAEAEENVKTQKFTRALNALQAFAITQDEFRDIVNRGNLLDVQLEKGVEIVRPGESDDDDNKPKTGENE